MDASDVIRRRLQQATYSSYIQYAQKATATCTSTSCQSTITTCNRNFDSYEERINVMNGMNYCLPSTCSTLCGLN